jgi:Fic family protein
MNEEYYTNIDTMEPLYPDDESGELEHLAETLLIKATALSKALHPKTREAIATFLRPMNSYYSNLIEGHDTHPIDIEKALNDNYSDLSVNRSLQLEAKAHIELHETICDLFKNSEPNPYDSSFIKFLHEEFYKKLPEDFKMAKRKDGSSIKIIPGEFRDCEVQVGAHVAPSSENLDSFITRFESFYNPKSASNKLKSRRLISIAASHHRLAWIHPFIDGNGRVIRLFSDASFILENVHSSGLWSMSRGLARKDNDYKTALAHADLQRWNDYDGRGNLSNRELINFCRFFLSTAIDQIEYMTNILDIDNMLGRIHSFVDLMITKGKLKDESRYILEAVFLKGTVPKKDIERLTGKSDKTAKSIADKLVEIGLLKTDASNRFAPYEVNYPITFSAILISGLYPKNKETDIIREILES